VRSRERAELALMLAPYGVGLGALVFLPAGVSVWLAFHEYDLLTPARWVGLGNFRELWGDDVFWTAARNSLTFVAAAVPLRLAGALALGLLLSRPFRGAGAARTAVYLPTAVPDVAYALLWLWILNPLYGPLNLALGAVGAPTPAWLTDPTSARWAVILMTVFTLGEGFVVVLAVRAGLPRELYELAAVEGAGPLRVLTGITLPLLAPALALLLLRDTIFSFQLNFVPALILTDGGPPPYATTYLPLFVYRNGFEYLRYGYAAAAALSLFALTLVVVWAQWRLLRRWRVAAAV
jgi:multiple sugar transport system permease protein